MAFQHDITVRNTRNGTVLADKTVSITADGEVNRQITVAGAATDYLIAFTCDVSQLKSILMKCDRAITIETNDGSSPGQTITLAADTPFVWYYGCGITNPLTTDITALYATLAAGASATLEIYMLVDATVS